MIGQFPPWNTSIAIFQHLPGFSTAEKNPQPEEHLVRFARSDAYYKKIAEIGPENSTSNSPTICVLWIFEGVSFGLTIPQHPKYNVFGRWGCVDDHYVTSFQGWTFRCRTVIGFSLQQWLSFSMVELHGWGNTSSLWFFATAIFVVSDLDQFDPRIGSQFRAANWPPSGYTLGLQSKVATRLRSCPRVVQLVGFRQPSTRCGLSKFIFCCTWFFPVFYELC